ncbi:hypothetical protein [Leptolyngbya sp. NIES-2104]|uniref:hypothetical protein n=1 Tax=Leptolyngbya sp. NIES-2104 TaxID=1552121 RepID=UPI0006ECA854|nr:hypothetical protein [Leptolyngbya sp. NIES-2104]GAQ00082.1 hypothetical protein NIES2104_66470 [Leptolyngbya sp. NIES-2104]
MLNFPDDPFSKANLDLLGPVDVIELMIDLRIQLAQLEHKLKRLQPVFFSACVTLDQAKIERDRAIVTRKYTPAQWTYAADVLEQELLLKQLRKQFQQDHEPTGGRDITWMIKLLLAQPS